MEQHEALVIMIQAGAVLAGQSLLPALWGKARAAGCVDEQPSNTSHSLLEKSRAASGFVQEPVPWALRNEARLLHCCEFALTCGIIIPAK